ncbi:nucleic acid-binding, OB-fold protein, partial [Tanacetum coccineum]
QPEGANVERTRPRCNGHGCSHDLPNVGRKFFHWKANKDDFCLLRFAHFMLELDGDTVVRKYSVSSDGLTYFQIYIMQLDAHQVINLAMDTHIPADATGYCDNVAGTSTESGSNDLDFHWLTDCGVELTKEMMPPDNTEAKAGTLENLLMWARNRKYDSSTFHCVVRIDKVRTKKGWNYPSCGGEKCKKGNLDRKDDRFWCDSYNSSLDYPVIRYRLELEIYDTTAEAVVVMFDETTKSLVKCSASSIVGSEDQVTFLVPRLFESYGY